MQRVDLAFCLVEAVVIADDVIRDGQAFVAARLRSEDPLCLFFRLGVAGQKSLNLGGFAAIDDKNAIHGLLKGRFDQKRYDDQLVAAARRIRLSKRLLANSWMQNALQFVAVLCVGENELAHCTSIQFAVIVENIVAERGADLVQRRLAGQNDFTGDNVGIDNRHPVTREQIGHGRFAARNAASQPDTHGPVFAWCLVGVHLQERVQVGVLERLSVKHRYPSRRSEIRAERYR